MYIIAERLDTRLSALWRKLQGSLCIESPVMLDKNGLDEKTIECLEKFVDDYVNKPIRVLYRGNMKYGDVYSLGNDNGWGSKMLFLREGDTFTECNGSGRTYSDSEKYTLVRMESNEDPEANQYAIIRKDN